MRRVLIVSPHFPPTNAPDHQRVRTSLPYFREYGWEPVVLAVRADDVEAPQDPLLSGTVPTDVPVYRVTALSARWTRRIGLGNVAYRAWSRLKREGDHLLGTGKFDLVYFSTTQFVVTALGRRWRRRFGVPFVIDIQDPWLTDYYERPGAPPPPGGWKYRFARKQAARLEAKSWRDASGFISVSADYRADLNSRYSWFKAAPFAVIPFGAAETDVECARDRPEILPAFRRLAGCVHLVNVGAVGHIMRPALDCLFAGVRTLRAADPLAASRLRFHFVGTSYAPTGRALPSVLPVAQAHGIEDLVEEQTERVGYFAALKTMLAADALVIPGSDDPAYNPSKIASCFLAAKPALALAPAGSVLARTVRELGLAESVDWAQPQSDAAVVAFLRRLLLEPPTPPVDHRNLALFAANYTARARTQQQCSLFLAAIGAKS